jgi:hypothetical protein
MIPGDGSVGYMVNYHAIEKWTDWDKEFFRKHDYSNLEVLNYGSHPSVICDAITAALADKIVYTLNTAATRNLLNELFSVVGRQACKMDLFDLEELFLHRLSAGGAASSVRALEEVRIQVAKDYPQYLCGGAFEVLYYTEIWKHIS